MIPTIPLASKCSSRQRQGQRPCRISFLARIAVVLACWCCCWSCMIEATNIKWTPGTNEVGNTNNQAAASAPRSQRYWDEHGIERPEYGKTDGEIAIERGETTGAGSRMLKILVLLSITGYTLHRYGYLQTIIGTTSVEGRGHSLGRANDAAWLPWLDGRKLGNTAEEARQARLAMFDHSLDEKID